MQIIDTGSGPTLVFVPGLQGRWEFMRTTVDALAAHFRVVTFSLCDEPAARCRFDAERGFDNYGDQVAAALDELKIRSAAICGVSFGGLIALNFASRYSDRVDALVLASTPGPGMTLRRRHAIYSRHPRLFGPLFFVEALRRARAELRVSLPAASQRRAFGWSMLRSLLRGRPSVARMAARARLIETFDAAAACARIAAPTLVVTGESGLDFVVRVDGSIQYLRLIRGARAAVLERTGHQGTLTRPREFAEIVRKFVEGTRDAAA